MLLVREELLMSKRTKILAGLTASVLLILAVSTTVMSVIMLINQQNINDMIAVYTGQFEDPAQEDDVTIGQHYVIKSTVQISDAYKSGDASALNDRDKETLDMAKEIIAQIIRPEMTSFEKEEAVYLFLTKGMKATASVLTVISDTSNDNDNPHDVLKNRTAVCVGYATTFRMFMQMLDIECMVVHNSGLGHSWDLVKLDDGCWYHTDCYMDNDSANYRNFNMDDMRCRQEGHEWNTTFFPAAMGKKYNYTLMKCQEIKDIYELPQAVMEGIYKKATTFSFSFKEPFKTTEDEAVAKYMADQLSDAITGTDKFYMSYQWTTNGKGEYVICYYISYNDDLAGDLKEKDKNKINTKISDILNKYKFYEKMFNN